MVWLQKEEIKIAAIQETKLTEKSKLSTNEMYTLVRKDRGKDKGGGLAFLIHKDVPFQLLPSPPDDPHTEHLAIKVGNLSIINLYIPPQSSCNTPDYSPSLTQFLHGEETIIIGDLNAHDALWFSALADQRGSKFSDEIGAANFGVLNEDHPTRLPTTGQASSPDISLASTDTLPYTSWETKTEMGSDHLPIVITIETDFKETKSDNRTFTNFKKADWGKFKEETEDKFAELSPPTNIVKGEKIFRKIINNAAKNAIPSGRIKNIFPNVPTETATKIRERDTLREADPTNPNLTQMNKDINSDINTYKRDKWRETVEKLDRKTNSAQLFKLIKNFNGEAKGNSNQAIKFKGKYSSGPMDAANKFNKQFTTVTRHVSTKTSRTTTKESKKMSLDNPIVYTKEQTTEAIKKAKASKALGPDNISTLHLKHIGPGGLQYLTDLFNISSATCIIPDIWKMSTIIPLLKPKKPAEDSTSYRPVSLLCPAVKILERLILPTLVKHLPIPDHQHGFRAKHSTVTALDEFNQKISQGFNKKKPASRTVLLQIDLSKAFDMVSHEKLLKDLNRSSLPESVKRWFNSYLHGRQSRVRFRDTTSSARNVRTGVPQGAVTSPILFNFYLAMLPSPPPGVFVVQYADDISVYVSGTEISLMSDMINNYIQKVLDFLRERELEVSPTKSTVTLFTPDTKEANIHPDVKMDGAKVDLVKTPKLLGVFFDTMYTFSHHIKETVKKSKGKVNALKSLAGSAWGQDKETLLITYKAVVRSTLEYGAPIWSPIISPTS